MWFIAWVLWPLSFCRTVNRSVILIWDKSDLVISCRSWIPPKKWSKVNSTAPDLVSGAADHMILWECAGLLIPNPFECMTRTIQVQSVLFHTCVLKLVCGRHLNICDDLDMVVNLWWFLCSELSLLNSRSLVSLVQIEPYILNVWICCIVSLTLTRKSKVAYCVHISSIWQYNYVFSIVTSVTEPHFLSNDRTLRGDESIFFQMW